MEQGQPQNGQQPATPEFQLVITMGPKGTNVSGPLSDKGLCYMMLELARDIVNEYYTASIAAKKQAPPLIVPPPGARVPTHLPDGRS